MENYCTKVMCQIVCIHLKTKTFPSLSLMCNTVWLSEMFNVFYSSVGNTLMYNVHVIIIIIWLWNTKHFDTIYYQ